MPVRVFGLHGASNTTGRSAKPCKSARPHRHRGVGRCTPSTLEPAVELRLGEKRAGRLEDVIGPAQFLDWHTSLGLFEKANDLFVGKSALLHGHLAPV